MRVSNLTLFIPIFIALACTSARDLRDLNKVAPPKHNAPIVSIAPPKDPVPISPKAKPSDSQNKVRWFNKSAAGRLITPVASSRWFASLLGKGADTKFSAKFISWFLDNHAKSIKDIADEFDNPEGDLTKHRTFNEFFTRKLSAKGKALRPFDMSPKVMASPADSALFVIPKLKKDSEIFVKGVKFDLAKFLGDEALAKEYTNGTLLLFYLAPDDYHRFHVPFDAEIIEGPKRIAGNLASVNPVGYSEKVQPLNTNERQLLLLKSPIFGQVAFVAVGAMFVGKIGFTFTSNTLLKGQDMGFFAFGGSTLVLLFKENEIKVNPEFIHQLSDKDFDEMFDQDEISLPMTKVRLGERIGISTK